MAEVSDLLLRVKLVGGGVAGVELAALSDGVKTFGDAAEVTGKKTAFAAEKNFLFGESMYSLRRYVFYGLTAIGATGAGILKMGYDFDEAKTKGVGALTALTGGATQATAEVNRLVTLTHTSGLGLSDLVTATQQMLTFKFAVRDTNAYMQAFANYSGKMGLGSGGVSSLVTLFDKIKNSGFINTRELNALSELGIPTLGPGGALSALAGPASGYSLSELQFLLSHNLLQVPAASGLPALAGWINQYAARQPTNLSQQWGILHGYLSQITGTVGAPVFNWLDKLAPRLNSLLGRASAGYKKGGTGGMLSALDPSDTLLHAWETFTNLLTATGRALQIIWAVAKPFALLLGVMATGFLTLTSHMRLLTPIITTLVGWYIVSRTWMVANVTWTWAMTTAQVAYRAAMALTIAALWVWDAAVALATGDAEAFGVAMSLLNATFLLNPVVLFGAALLAVGYAAYQAYEHVGWFRKDVNLLWHDLAYAAPLVAAALTIAFGPIGVAVTGLLLVIRYWSQIKGFFEGTQLSKGDLLKGSEQRSLVGTFGLAATAQMENRAGVTVSQLQASGASAALVAALERDIHVHVDVDGQELARTVAKHRTIIGEATFHAKSDAEARR